jgi:hypothetical protein
MTDQQEPVEAERPPEETSASEQTGQAGAGETAGATHGPGSGTAEGIGLWPDLDAYCAQLRAEHAAWVERLTAVQTQLASVRPSLLGIAAQYRALGIEDDLALLNEMVLGGIGMAQSVRLGHDLERYIALFWPVSGDPRPAMTRAEDEGEYRIEVWMLLGPDGKGRIRVEGEKRLEATLPTSRERLRGVLLRAVQAPKFVSRGEPAAAEETQPAGVTKADDSGADRPEPETDPAAEAQPRAGDPEQQPPPDEQVIPLGPSESTTAGADGGERSATGG